MLCTFLWVLQFINHVMHVGLTLTWFLVSSPAPPTSFITACVHLVWWASPFTGKEGSGIMPIIIMRVVLLQPNQIVPHIPFFSCEGASLPDCILIKIIWALTIAADCSMHWGFWTIVLHCTEFYLILIHMYILHVGYGISTLTHIFWTGAGWAVWNRVKYM